MKIKVFAIIAALAVLVGCTANPYTGERQMAKSAKYGTVAAVTGGIVGALVGGEKGAYIGAGLGAAMGGGYGYYTDRQEKALREQIVAANESMEVSRTADNRLMVTMPGDINFRTGSAELSPSNYQALSVIAQTVLQNRGAMLIVGHTDNTGSLQLNESLSVARAQSVASYMYAQGVPFGAVNVQGMAYHQPIADNATAEGRSKNRRVEIILQ
jgi:outer membrane protein OmpA-like peptidoglycan-associated protein